MTLRAQAGICSAYPKQWRCHYGTALKARAFKTGILGKGNNQGSRMIVGSVVKPSGS